jgi:hypothetical protein
MSAALFQSASPCPSAVLERWYSTVTGGEHVEEDHTCGIAVSSSFSSNSSSPNSERMEPPSTSPAFGSAVEDEDEASSCAFSSSYLSQK